MGLIRKSAEKFIEKAEDQSFYWDIRDDYSESGKQKEKAWEQQKADRKR